METKTCCRCNETKLLTEFNLKPQAACKACINIYQAIYRERTKERRNAAGRVRYIERRDELRDKGARYRKQHQARLNASQREYAKREDRVVADRELRRKYRAELTDAFVRRALTKKTGISSASVPLELISLKRLQLQIMRSIQNG